MIDHFGFIAPWYERFIPPPSVDLLKRLLALPAPGALLDVGGGTGRVASQLVGHIESITIVDPSLGMLKQALKRPALTVVQGQVEHLPFATGTFHRILVVDALHHFADARIAMHEMLRVLAPGGRLLIQEPDWRLPRIRLISWAERLLLMQSHPYPPQAIATMAQAQGAGAHWLASGNGIAWVIVHKPSTSPHEAH